jgi:hypothetical protein
LNVEWSDEETKNKRAYSVEARQPLRLCTEGAVLVVLAETGLSRFAVVPRDSAPLFLGKYDFRFSHRYPV